MTYPMSPINVPKGPAMSPGQSPKPWWQANDWGAGPPAPASQYGFDLSSGDWGKEDIINKLLQALQFSGMNAAAFQTGFLQPNMEKTITALFQGLSPEGARARARGIGQSTMSEAQSLARRQAAVVGANGGSSALQQSIINSGLNQGREMATQQFAKATDPLENLMKQLQVLGQGSQDPFIQMLLQASGAGPEQTHQGNGWGDTIAGLLGSVPWGNVFG